MNFMNDNKTIVIGIDHGYGNIKTAHCCFKTGVAVYDKEPTFKNNLLIYDGKYYTVGEEHKEFVSDKMADSDYYILTLAAVARELNIRKLHRLDKKLYRSYSKAVVAAVNDYFDRQERLAADPYLETREKEDAFLQKIAETIEAGLRSAPLSMLPQTITALATTPPAPEPAQDSEDMAAVLDFADGF